MGHLLTEDETVEERRSSGGADAVSGVRGGRVLVIDYIMALRPTDDAGRVHGTGHAEDLPSASGKPASTVVDRVPGGNGGRGGALFHGADGDAHPMSGIASPAATFEQSSAPPRVGHEAQGEIPALCASSGTGTGL